MTQEQETLERNYVELAEAFKKLAGDYQALSQRYQTEKMYREMLQAVLEAIRERHRQPKTNEEKILQAVTGPKSIELKRENGQLVGAVVKQQ